MSCVFAFGQSTLPLRADTVVVEKVGGHATLKIKNNTRDTLGVLTNVGGGATRFIRSKKYNDTCLIIGSDTICGIGGVIPDTLVVEALRTSVLLPDTTSQEPFEFIILPDMQESNQHEPDAFNAAFDYIVDNKAANNIQGVISVGDICNTADNTEMNRALTAFNSLDAANIPNLPIMGNHDYDGGNISGGVRGVTQWNTYFPPSRFTGLPWWGGNLGSTTENYYITFDVGRYKFLAIGLEFVPTDASLDWAQGIIDANPDRKVIISTHAYMTVWGERARDTSLYGPSAYGLGADNSGQELWDKLIRKNKNIILVFGGHYIHAPVSIGHLKRISEAGDSGNVVHQIMVNYQQHLTAPYLSGADGFIMRFRVNPSTSTATVHMYSPFLGVSDTQIDTFSIDLTPIRVEGSLSIKNGLYVANEAVFDGAVNVMDIPRDRVVMTSINGKLDSIPFQTANTVFAGPATGSAANPTFRALAAADLPIGSGNYIQNQSLTTQGASFRISGSGYIGNYNGSGAKISPYPSPGTPAIASGPLLSTQIYNGFHSVDTVTSSFTAAGAMLRNTQIQWDRRYLDDNLNITDSRGFNVTAVHRLRNRVIFNNDVSTIAGADQGFYLRQYGGFSGTSIASGRANADSAISGTVSRIDIINAGGSNAIDAEGWYAAYSAYVGSGNRDTIDNLIGYNTYLGKSSGTIKNLYHHYIHGAFGTNSNWGIYQEGSTLPNYFQGGVYLNRTAPIGSEKLSINGTINANADSTATPTGGFVYKDYTTGEWKITAAAGIYNGSRTWDGDYTQNVNHKNLYFDSAKDFRITIHENDAALIDYKTRMIFGYGGNFMTQGPAWFYTLRNKANTLDSLTNSIYFNQGTSALSGFRSATGGENTTGLIRASGHGRGEVLLSATRAVFPSSTVSLMSVNYQRISIDASDTLLISSRSMDYEPAAGDTAMNFVSTTTETGRPALRAVKTRMPLSYMASDSAASAATVDIDLSDFVGFDRVVIYIDKIDVSNDDVELRARFSSNGGSSFNSGATDYEWLVNWKITAPSDGVNADASDDHVTLIQNMGNAAGYSAGGKIEILHPFDATYMPMYTGDFITNYFATGAIIVSNVGGRQTSNSVLNAIRFYPSAGTFDKFKYRVVGYKN